MQDLGEIEQYLIEGIEQGKINFFVGAGISVGLPAKMPSGAGLTQELLKDWVSDGVGDSLKDHAKSGALRLEVVMQIDRETFSDRKIVLHPLLQFMDRSPNCNHYLLAFALKNGCTVITTNFDILIEIAYWNLYGSLPPVIIADSQSRRTVSRGSLIKIHGSIAILETVNNSELSVRDARETVMAALDQVAQGLGDGKTATLQQLLQQAPTFFWGYSCMDDFDVYPVLGSTERRKTFYWLFFESGKFLELLSGDGWKSFVSEINSRSHLEDSKRFESANVSSTLTHSDFRIVGDSSNWMEHLNEIWNLKAQKKFEVQVNSKLSAFLESMGSARTQKPGAWELQLLGARLLEQAGEWGDKMHSLYSKVHENVALDPDLRIRIQTEHADKTAPHDLIKASEILNKHQDDYEDATNDTKAYALAILSNIRRRQKKKDAKNFIQKAVDIIQEGNVNDETIFRVFHYQALLFHQEMAEDVKHLKSDSELKPEFLAEIRRCEELFSGGSSFFKDHGLVNDFAMSQNGLSLLLIEKGKALKNVGHIEDANKVFENAANILFEDVAETRMRYGYFRGVGQAYRNIALARQSQENYKETLHALDQADHFYSKVKPTPPPTDLFEVFYRQAETLLKLNTPEKALQPISRWILQKRASADWHDEARGLKVLAEALKGMGREFDLDAEYAVNLILDIYRDVLSNESKRDTLKNRRFGMENANENLIFAQQLAKDLGIDAQEQKAVGLLKQLDTL
jgi:tetratricopeptide (TPR) repeat protein